MKNVSPKKYLGQHFLKDETIAQKIGESLNQSNTYDGILEVGPGMGVMTKYIRKKYPSHDFRLIELDTESVAFLNVNYPLIKVYNDDFLKLNFKNVFDGEFAVIGNYPYNISSQIVFKVIENRALIPEMSGMFQKEVAERICECPGNKSYGVISVLTQAFYDCEYLFTVPEHVFNPPPKVKSGVIRLVRKEKPISCDYGAFKHLVKTAFNQRRKMLRKSLKALFEEETLKLEVFTKRPEQLSVDDFVELVALKKTN
ncbi:MAG: 16S rRNA (adenine(1518)-N(6)/adenine(1519)-N(6))-dimethyltransferase [Flavobacteriales bacterium]|nr:16S rRNA (adenine(1518)-N(6)/adenine(1519)-N(6))-dimethyltransferase [Flavobacteriales bacterium]